MEEKENLMELSKERLIEMIGERERRIESLKGEIEWWQDECARVTDRHDALRQAMECVLALSGKR